MINYLLTLIMAFVPQNNVLDAFKTMFKCHCGKGDNRTQKSEKKSIKITED